MDKYRCKVSDHHMTERAQATLNPAQNDLECVIQVEGVSKVFHTPSQTNLEALTDIKLDVRPGEFVTVVGPSGCGSTLNVFRARTGSARSANLSPSRVSPVLKNIIHPSCRAA